jgi:hypothetical protein
MAKRLVLRVEVKRIGRRHYLASERYTREWADGRTPFAALRHLTAGLAEYWRTLDSEGEAGLGLGLQRDYRALADFLGKPVNPGDPAAVAARGERRRALAAAAQAVSAEKGEGNATDH